MVVVGGRRGPVELTRQTQIYQVGIKTSRNVVWLGSMIYGIGLWTSASCVVWSIVELVRMATELKYHNTP